MKYGNIPSKFPCQEQHSETVSKLGVNELGAKVMRLATNGSLVESDGK